MPKDIPHDYAQYYTEYVAYYEDEYNSTEHELHTKNKLLNNTSTGTLFCQECFDEIFNPTVLAIANFENEEELITLLQL